MTVVRGRVAVSIVVAVVAGCVASMPTASAGAADGPGYREIHVSLDTRTGTVTEDMPAGCEAPWDTDGDNRCSGRFPSTGSDAPWADQDGWLTSERVDDQQTNLNVLVPGAELHGRTSDAAPGAYTVIRGETSWGTNLRTGTADGALPGEVGGPLALTIDGTCPDPGTDCGYLIELSGWILADRPAAPPALTAGASWMYFSFILTSSYFGCTGNWGQSWYECNGLYNRYETWPFTDTNDATVRIGRWDFPQRDPGGQLNFPVKFYTPGAEISGWVPTRFSDRFEVLRAAVPWGPVLVPEQVHQNVSPPAGAKGGPLFIAVRSDGPLDNDFIRVKGWLEVGPAAAPASPAPTTSPTRSTAATPVATRPRFTG